MLTGEEVDEVLGHTKSLIQILEDTISRCKTLITAIDESPCQSAELISEHFFLHSLTGRLGDASGAGQKLCKELLQFKFKLGTLSDAGSFHARIQASIERKKDELEEKCAELQMERSALEEERGVSAKTKGKCKKCSSKRTAEKEETKNSKECSSRSIVEEEERGEKVGDECLDEILMWHLKLQAEKAEEAIDAKAAVEKDLRDVSDKVQSQSRTIEALATQLFIRPQSHNGAQNCHESEVNRHDAGCQTVGATTCKSCTVEWPLQKDKRDALELLVYQHPDEGNTGNDSLFSSWQPSQPKQLTIGRVSTAPVSRARANLLLRQGHLTRLIKALLEENTRLKEGLQRLKIDNSTLWKRVKEATSELNYMKNQLSVNAMDKEGLQKKMQKFKEQNQQLENALKKQASGFVQSRKQQKQIEEEIRWSQIPAVSRTRSEKRLHRISQENRQFNVIKNHRCIWYSKENL